MIVYRYTNTVNNKVYIGITTKTLKQRHRQHLKSLNDGTLFHNALKKYGVDLFELEIIDQAETREELMELERYYIQKHNSFTYIKNGYGYNCTPGGDGVLGAYGKNNSQYGISPKQRMTEEKYKKWQEVMRNPCEETRIKMREVWKGNQYFLGKKHTEETKRLFSEIRKGRVPVNMAKVNQYDLDGNFVATYISIKEATQAMTKSKSGAAICSCCKGNRKTAFGYLWKYSDESEKN